MDLILLACFALFAFFIYPIIVSNIKVGGLREQVHDAMVRVLALERELAAVRQRVALLEGEGVRSAPAPESVPVTVPGSVTVPAAEPVPVPAAAPALPPRVSVMPPAAPVVTEPAEAVPAPLPPLAPAWLRAIRNWLFTGNLVAKFGLLILIASVHGFLVTYLAQRVHTPIELRLAGVVVLDIGLLLWGWRIRTTRRDVALPVQGAAVAILMLVVFAAFSRLHLIPAALAFPLLVALTASTCVLALLQDAFWLAVFGIIGGFAAPLLVSTGSGNHVALFSYYALLNAGILALALRRSWRALHVLGFAATFLIGGAWGLQRYEPAHYASAQGFLILFFLMYVAIALAWARRRAPRFNDAVDATLVFGTPAAAFAMQYGLVRHTAFGVAFSALALGLFYLGLAAVLLRTRREKARQDLLMSTFVALATIFGTLAIPFALTGSWTSAAWALEGAGLVWVGLRQHRPAAWGFGLLVQYGAWSAFLAAAGVPPGFLFVGGLLLLGGAGMLVRALRTPGLHVNRLVVVQHLLAAAVLAPPAATGGLENAPLLLGSSLLAVAADCTSWLFRADDAGRRTVSHSLLVWAGAWWCGPALWAAARLSAGGVPAPRLATSGVLHAALYTVLVCATALAALPAARRLSWPALRWFSVPAWAALVGTSLALLFQLYERITWPTAAQGLAWVVAWASGDYLLRRWEAARWPLSDGWRKLLHGARTGMPWLMLWPLFSWLIASWLTVAPEQQDLLAMSGWRVAGSWSHFLPTWLMIVGMFWLVARTRARLWPTSPIAQWYREVVIPSAAGWFMLLALFWNLQQDGAMAPLPYLPLLNPLDLSTAFALLLWLASHRLWIAGQATDEPLPVLVARMPVIAAFAAWGWLNLVLVRSAAHYLGIPYDPEALGSSTFIQAMLSLAWSLSALGIMRHAGKRAPGAARTLWLLGAALLGIVVAKLFLVDLSNTGSIARIVSFVGVGVLMVAIGYLAPYPTAVPDRSPA